MQIQPVLFVTVLNGFSEIGTLDGTEIRINPVKEGHHLRNLHGQVLAHVYNVIFFSFGIDHKTSDMKWIGAVIRTGFKLNDVGEFSRENPILSLRINDEDSVCFT